jgi:hypothetical protein
MLVTIAELRRIVKNKMGTNGRGWKREWTDNELAPF